MTTENASHEPDKMKALLVAAASIAVTVVLWAVIKTYFQQAFERHASQVMLALALLALLSFVVSWLLD